MADDGLIPKTPSAKEYKSGKEAFNVAEDQGEVFTSGDPIELFISWFQLARKHEVNDANAMSLATADTSGLPDVRVVLLKDVSASGFSFYSNSESAKGEELQANPQAALCFHWKSIRRQVRIRGQVEALSNSECDNYFAERARGSQIGAWASFQSRPLEDREILRQRVADYEEIYEDKPVPRPENWIGWIVRPQTIEFWVNRPFRLHDRLLFTSNPEGWQQSWLYP
ncbi:MAG: pyridoxamine 5'-phosphate oxidase [Aquisalinus sp.]|nr:pyridoxamine 5'-phosphate oxidase [Aquisalinus sp.]